MVVTQKELEDLAAALGDDLRARGWMLAVAESCTGGWAAQALTAIAGSSDWFDRGFVTYSNAAKRELLGVNEATLERRGAVSEETVREMAVGVLCHSQAQAVFAISGIAGPGGGTAEKPVGTVCFAWATLGSATVSATVQFSGDRQQVRAQSVAYAFRQMRALLAAMR